MAIPKRKNIDLSYIFTVICITFFLGGFFLTFYKSEIVFHGLIRKHYQSYYIFFIFSLIIFSSFLFVKHELRIKFNLIITSTLIGLYFSELLIASNFIKFLLTANYHFKAESVNFNKKTEAEYLKNLRKKGVDAVPRLLPGFFTISDGIKTSANKKVYPLSGISNRQTVQCREEGEMISYFSDRYGFNNSDDIWDKLPIDFVILGDSFVQGDCVTQKEAVTNQLSSLTNLKGISLGMGGNGPLTELATLIEYAKPLKPKTIYWFYFEGNDFFELETEQSSNTLMLYLSKDYTQDLLSKQDEINKNLEIWLKSQTFDRDKYKIINFIYLKSLRTFLTQNILQNTARLGDFNNSLPVLKKILIRANKIVKEWNGSLVFVYLPEFGRYSKHVDHNLYLERKKLLDEVKNIPLQTVDVHNCFVKQKDVLDLFPFRQNGHYNPHGYNILARCIADNLDDLKTANFINLRNK